MERKIISHRIGSILDDISRLSNALYAMDTTDIQRYPDNYEVLSTDAALRAEKIACRLRHLIYSSTTIRKGDYLTSAGIVHGIEVVYEDGVLEVTLPGVSARPVLLLIGAIRQRASHAPLQRLCGVLYAGL